jgi:hypothetical protein
VLLAARAYALLDRLALAERTGQPDPLRLLDLVERIEAGGALVVVTGGREPATVARLAEQRRRFTPVVVVTMSGTGTGTRRRPGMAVLAARDGADAAAAWNRMVSGAAG